MMDAKNMRETIIHKIAALLAVAALCAAGTGCTGKLDAPQTLPAGDEILFAGTPLSAPATKTAYSGEVVSIGGQEYERLNWVRGDVIRIWRADPSPDWCDYQVDGITSEGRTSTANVLSPCGPKSRLRWGKDTPHSFRAMYPSPSSAPVSGVGTFTEDLLHFSLPGVQDGKDMRYAYMVAGTTADPRDGASVSLGFQMAVTPLRLVLTPSSGYNYPGNQLTVTSVTLTTSGADSYLSGAWTADMGKTPVEYAWNTGVARGKELSLDFPAGGRTLRYGERDTVYFFIPPFPVTDAILTVTTEQGDITLSLPPIEPGCFLSVTPNDGLPRELAEETMSFVIAASSGSRSFCVPFQPIEAPTDLTIFWGDINGSFTRIPRGTIVEEALRTFEYQANDLGEHTITIIAAAPEDYLANPSNPRIPPFNFNAFSTSGLMLTEMLTPLLPYAETNADYTFSGCMNLRSVPAGLFSRNPQLTSMMDIFFWCSSLKTVPEQLFAGMENVTDLSLAFCRSGIESLSPGTLSPLVSAENCMGMFYECKSLSTIPDGLFAGLSNVTNFNRVFDSSGITNLPEDTFSGCGSAKHFDYAFQNCTYLTGPIPENLFFACRDSNNTVGIESFFCLFSGCANLGGTIPPGLFKECRKAWDFRRIFINCSSLEGTIPGTLFEDCVEATQFNYAFSRCTGLTNDPSGYFVPEKLFWNCKKVQTINYTFECCYNLHGKIPPRLLKDKPVLNSIMGMCSDMGNGFGTEAVGIGLLVQDNGQLIPEQLLWEAPNLKNANRAFQTAFDKAHRGHLPGALFHNNPLLETAIFFVGYNDCVIADPSASGHIVSEDFFVNNEKLTNISDFFDYNFCLNGSLPAGLFRNLKNLENIARMFYRTDLTNLPDKLLAYNPKLTNMNSAFRSCPRMKLSAGIFIDPASGITKANRFAGVTPNFQETFNSAGNQLGNSGGVAGTLPDLWNYTYGGNGSPSNTTSCFRPVNARFTNHASVPAAWK